MIRAGAGQMIVCGTPVTFCFTVNWRGPDAGVAPMFAAYRDAVAGVLAAVADGIRTAGTA